MKSNVVGTQFSGEVWMPRVSNCKPEALSPRAIISKRQKQLFLFIMIQGPAISDRLSDEQIGWFQVRSFLLSDDLDGD
jgi:hypothetical protein